MIENVNTEENHIDTENDLKTPENPSQNASFHKNSDTLEIIPFDNESIEYENVNIGESPKKSFEEQFNELLKKEEEKIKEAYTLFNKLKEVTLNIGESPKKSFEEQFNELVKEEEEEIKEVYTLFNKLKEVTLNKDISEDHKSDS